MDDEQFGDDLYINQSILQQQRELSRSFHITHNSEILKGFDLPEYVTVSCYSPFLSTTILTEKEANDFAERLTKHFGEKLNDVWIDPVRDSEDKTLIEDRGSGKKRELQNASNIRQKLVPLLGENDPPYDGTGINFGIIDGGLIGSTYVLSGHSISNGGGSAIESHPTMMAAVGAGDTGVAPGVDLFSFSYNRVDTRSLTLLIGWLNKV